MAKNAVQLHAVDRPEKAVWRRKLVRDDWIKVLLDRIEPGCEIGMEACGARITGFCFRRLLRGLWRDLLAHDERVEELDRKIEEIARQDPVAVRLQQLRGTGPVRNLSSVMA